MGVDMLLLDAKVDYFDHLSLSDLRSHEKAYKVIIVFFKSLRRLRVDTYRGKALFMGLVDLLSQEATQTNV